MNARSHSLSPSGVRVLCWSWGAGALLALAGGVVLFEFDPSRFSFYPTCQFHRLTGLLCPGCGSLRALHHLLHGRVVTALHFNALLVLGLPCLAGLALRASMGLLRNQPLPEGLRPAWLWCALAVMLAFGILRNLF